MRKALIGAVLAAALGVAVLSADTAKAEYIDSGSGGCWCGGDNPPSTWGWGLQYHPATDSWHWAYCYGAPFNGGYC